MSCTSKKKLCYIFRGEEYLRLQLVYLDRVTEIVESKRDLDFGFILLNCFIDELASVRYPSDKVKERLKKLLQNYCGNEFLQIDLLYLYQWQKNDYIKSNSGGYWCSLMKELDLYNDIAESIKKQFGDEEALKENDGQRYCTSDVIIEHLSVAVKWLH